MGLNFIYLDHDVTALPERGALHGEGLGSAGISGSEIEIIGHFVFYEDLKDE